MGFVWFAGTFQGGTQQAFTDIFSLGDSLPSDADLEAMIQELPTTPVASDDNVQDLARAQVDVDNVDRRRKVVGKSGAASGTVHDVLGGCGAGVPKEVHDIALGFSNRVVLPFSTPMQHVRNRQSPGTD